MNTVKDKHSLKKSGHRPVKKDHSRKRFLKSHVEKKYFKGISRNASSIRNQETKNPKKLELIKFTFSPPASFLDIPDLTVNICADINRNVTLVKEVSNNLILYKTQLFRARAIIDVPSLPEGTDIQIGFIQVCTKGMNPIFYGDNTIFSWEIPELVSGKYSMFLDSTKESMPWYDNESGLIDLTGPFPPSRATININDTPCGSTTWCDPTADENSKPTLTYMYRRQDFLTYLVIKNMKNNTHQIIKCIKWNIEVAIELDPEKKLGERVVFIGPCSSDQPQLLSIEETPPLEENIFQPFVANDCLLFANRSKIKKSKIEMEAEETTVNMDTYIDQTESYTSDLFKVTKRNFLLNYKRKDE